MTLYLEHFSLRELPFRITPAVDFFYRGAMRGEILDALKYAVRNGEGIMAVFGEAGSGKSMLARVLMNSLKDKADLVYVANPSLSDREIVLKMAEELGLPTDAELCDVARNLHNHLIKLHAKGRRMVVCIDEAQAVPDESLEQMRLFPNLEASRGKLVQIVMFGRPELAEKLDQQHMRQLRERISSSCQLRNLQPAEVREYIGVRLASAGLADGRELFSGKCCAHIAHVSQGISRRINILCDKAMLAACADDAKTIGLKHAKLASADASCQKLNYRLGRSDRRQKPRRNPAGTIIAAVAIAAAAGANAFQFSQQDNEKSGSTPAAVLASVQETAAVSGQKEAAIIDNPRWRLYPAGSYLRQRLNATQTLLGKLKTSKYYTARMLTASRGRVLEIEKYLRDLAKFYLIRNVMVYPAGSYDKQTFVITYGQHESEFLAELFVHELPSFFKSGKPFVQALSVSRLESMEQW